MSTTPRVPTAWTGREVWPDPSEKSKEEVLVKLVDDSLYYTHPLRSLDVSVWRRAELYDECLQWLQRAGAGYDERGATSLWAAPQRFGFRDENGVWVDDGVPRPVLNEGLGARINETARLGQPNPRPIAKPAAEHPDLDSMVAAEKAQRRLRDRLKRMDWEDVLYPQIGYHMPLYGGAWLLSRWVQRWDKTAPVAKQTVHACAHCQFRVASLTIPTDMSTDKAPWLGSTIAPRGAKGFDLQACPMCSAMGMDSPMQPLNGKLTQEEVMEGEDSLGQPLGEHLPMGDWQLSIPSSYDVFVPQLGFGGRAFGHVPDFTYVHVESLDTIALEYPDKAAEVEAENPRTLSQYHPNLGTPDMQQGEAGSRAFRESARVRERHRAPWLEVTQRQDGSYAWAMNRGRSLVVAGKKVLYYGDYQVESLTEPGTFVDRQHLEYMPWELRDGARRLGGIGLWELNFDAQDGVNETASQIQAVRRRLAVPFYIKDRGANLEPSNLPGLPGVMVEANLDPGNSQPPMQLLNNETIAPGVFSEKNEYVDFINRQTPKVETGNAGSVTANAAMVTLLGQAQTSRELRIVRMLGSIKRAWKHGHELGAALEIEARPCACEEDDGTETHEMISGADLDADADIDIETEPSQDDEAKGAQGVMNLVQAKAIDPSTFTASQKRRLAKLFDADAHLFEEYDYQERAAQREGIAFRKTRALPRVDPALDDHDTHHEVHGRECHDEWFRALEKLAGWDEALKVLADDWFDDVTAAQQAPAAYAAIAQQAAAMNQPPPPAPPTNLEQRIVAARAQKLMAVGLLAPPKPGAVEVDPKRDALMAVLQWRAHMDAHRAILEGLQTAASAGAAVTAAPGAEETAAGTQVAPGKEPPAEPGAPGVAPLAALPTAAVQ